MGVLGHEFERVAISDQARSALFFRDHPVCRIYLASPAAEDSAFAVNPRRGSSKVRTEIRNALTAWRHSLEKRRIQANVCRRGRTGTSTATLRDQKGRTESSGNVCSNWGYLAEEREADGVNQLGVGVRRDRIWLTR